MKEQTLPPTLDIARQLAALPEDTDANDWPYRNDILYMLKDYLLWAEVCQLGIKLPQSNPIRQISFMIEWVNAWRRQEGLWDIKLAVTMLDAVKLRTDSLPEDHPRRSRLTVLRAYHAGWVYHPAGEFAKAAECHRVSATFATNERDRVLSLYNAADAMLNDALAQGDRARIVEAYTKFQVVAEDMEEHLQSDSDEDVRWRLSMACHRLTFAWLCNAECPDAAGELARLEATPDSLKPSFDEVLPLTRALGARSDGNSADALQHTLQVNEKTTAGWRSLTLLLRAELQDATGDQSGADATHQEILHLAERAHGAHLAKALVLQRQSAS